MKRFVTMFGSVLVVALIATFSITAESKSAVTQQGAKNAIMAIDGQLVQAGVDASFGEALSGQPNAMGDGFTCEMGPIFWAQRMWILCRTDKVPPTHCAVCWHECRDSCDFAYWVCEGWSEEDAVNCEGVCTGMCQIDPGCVPSTDCVPGVPVQPSE